MPFIFKLNSAGVRELLRSEGVQADLKRRADAIATAANTAAGLTDGFVVDNNIGANRARSAVVTATFDAMLAEAKDQILTRAIDAGRG